MEHAPHGHVGGDLALERLGHRRRTPRHESRGRLRAPHRRGDLVMEAATAPPPATAAPPRRRLGRLERAALQGVMVREVVNFSSFWRTSTFSSTVDPTI